MLKERSGAAIFFCRCCRIEIRTLPHDLHLPAARPSADPTAERQLTRPLLVSARTAGAAVGLRWLLDVASEFRHALDRICKVSRGGEVSPELKRLPSLVIGAGMMTMALGLLWRSRLAWVMSVLLAATAVVNTVFAGHTDVKMLLAYFAFVLASLLLTWRSFDRSSVAASTLFALSAVTMLVMYATFGTYNLGTQFKPRITDLVTAFYYAMVTMSTVGYGDIVPATPQARLFALSVIVLGVAVFATSLTAVVGPLVGRSLQDIVKRKGRRMRRENHFVVIGNTPLAINTWRELAKRGRPVLAFCERRRKKARTKMSTWWWAIPA